MQAIGRNRWLGACLVTVLIGISPAVAHDSAGTYFSIPVDSLIGPPESWNIVAGPDELDPSIIRTDSWPHLAVPAGVEAFLLAPEANGQTGDFGAYKIVGRKPSDQAISGRLYLVRQHPEQPESKCLVQFDFDVAAIPEQRALQRQFLLARGQRMRQWWSDGVAGAAVFRHLANTSLTPEQRDWTGATGGGRSSRSAGVDRTIQMASGGRAVSENLQLDAQLQLPRNDDASTLVSVTSIRGVRVPEMDWDPLLRNEPTELDSLARRIPQDQYAVFLPSFHVLTQLIDRGEHLSNPLVRWVEPHSRKTDVIGFYQSQLGLELNQLTRQVGRALIDEVAITGSDPYFRTGTDIAVLMRTRQPALLHQSILAQVTGQAARFDGVKKVDHKVDNHVFTQWSTDDRRFCSFVALHDDTVIVSNSRHQMQQVLRVADGRRSSMLELDEYRFFRQRYPRNSESDSALLVVTDAAIRRWCGPEWRIGASRRTRARATIADATAAHADALVRREVARSRVIRAPADAPQIGALMLTPGGVYSTKYGTLDYQTPIAELNLRHVTSGEKQMYERWRNSYERRWRRVFDPIALHVSLRDDGIDADLTVIPLVLQSEYQFYRGWVGETHLRSEGGDPHPEALATMRMALDTNSQWMNFANTIFSNGGQFNIRVSDWIHDEITVYFDYDKQWLERLANRDPWRLGLTDDLRQVPVGVFIPSKNNLKMTAFLVAARSAIDRFAPNMFRWENVTYKDAQYVVGTVTNTVLGNADEFPRLYYVTTSHGLTLSTNARVIERVIDRHIVSNQPGSKDSPAAEETADEHFVMDAPPLDPSTDPQLALQATGKGLEIMSKTNYESALRQMQRLAWNNIPIMNYFRGRYPDRDPREVYFELFGEQLVEPTGGEYEWSERFGTYVSTQHGFSLVPKIGPPMPESLKPNDFVRAAFGFQDGGLRATLHVKSQP